MQEFLLGIVEITLGMSLLILLMLMLLKFIGGKFTAKCRYILWTLVMIRLAIPLGFGILPALIEVPVETEPEGKIIAVIPDMEMSAPPQIIRDPLIYSRDTPVDYIPVPSEPEPFASESVTEEPITWEDVKTYIPHIYLIGTADSCCGICCPTGFTQLKSSIPPKKYIRIHRKSTKPSAGRRGCPARRYFWFHPM